MYATITSFTLDDRFIRRSDNRFDLYVAVNTAVKTKIDPDNEYDNPHEYMIRFIDDGYAKHFGMSFTIDVCRQFETAICRIINDRIGAGNRADLVVINLGLFPRIVINVYRHLADVCNEFGPNFSDVLVTLSTVCAARQQTVLYINPFAQFVGIKIVDY